MDRMLVGILLAAAAALPGRSLQTALTIDHEAVGCVLAEKHPRLQARFDPAAEVARARVYFRAAGTGPWYWAEMAIEAGIGSGVLPKPKRSTARIEYYVEAIDKAFATTRTAERTAAVVDGPAACRKELPLAAATSSARVVVGAAPGAPAVPAGFLKTGLLAAGHGVSTAVILGIVGGGAAIGGTALVLGGDPRDEPPPPPVPSVDGSWVGTGADGLFREQVDSLTPSLNCRREDDLFLDLQQAGQAIRGEARLVSRVNTCGPEPLGTVRIHSVTGSLSGANVTLTAMPSATGGASTHTWTGTLAGSRMNGAATSVAGTIMGRGTWSVRRP
jgi:hypothetical protein